MLFLLFNNSKQKAGLFYYNPRTGFWSFQTLTTQRLAHFLDNIVDAWQESGQNQRNRLARNLFGEMKLDSNDKVVAVTPRAEFKPFFELQYNGLSHYVLHWRPRGESEFNAIP